MHERFRLREEDFFNRSRFNELSIHRNRLPHRDIPGIIQFITFRLADSIPSDILEFFDNHKKSLIDRYGDTSRWSRDTWNEYYRLRESTEKFLDKGYGGCQLAEGVLRQMLSDLLFQYDDDLYDLFAFVIMPNHVHILIRQWRDVDYIMQLIKGMSSTAIGEVSAGFEWQREYWDTMLRSQESFQQKLRYINRNPAHLPPGTFTLYQNPHIILPRRTP